MNETTRDALRSLIDAREDFALKQLEKDPEYLSVCQEQEKTEKIVDELLMKLEKPDRITIRRHYEGELNKTDYEIKAAYIQGLRDCFSLLDFLTGNEVCI